MQNTCTRNQGWTGPPRKWCSTSAPNPPGTATAVPLFLFRVTRAPELRQDSPAGGAGRTPRPFGSSSTPHLATRALSYSASPSCWRRMASSSSSPAPAPAGESLRQKRILSSKLYLDVPSSKAPVVYSPAYDISFLGFEKLHPFESAKWGRICRYLTREGHLEKKKLVEPLEACKEDLLVVHTEKYLNSLKSSYRVASIVEVPPVSLVPNWIVHKKLLYPFRKQVGGSILSAKLALERGWSINVGGGFHHCSAEEGGGFCAYADISLCIQFAFVRLNISSVLIIDLDAHQGNGHEKDFANDGRVYILDMYNAGIYPFLYFGPFQDFTAKQYIDQKVELVSGTKTDEYLEQLDNALEFLLEHIVCRYAKVDFSPS
ncbi:hypothetical protein PAHAL_4G105200 [Panicum hallii]|uniref:Histone deacetylase domain-containing protein n=1 Tax=Panicum hallii TaxID=206008 RepID=A0A2T8JCJ0_9POAL|nr:hypothetical protein PAHAL_4G105200 [Panicum hallii]